MPPVSREMFLFDGAVFLLNTKHRYAIAAKRCAQDPRERNQARHGHNRDDIQLHRRTAAGRRQGDHDNLAKHVGCH